MKKIFLGLLICLLPFLAFASETDWRQEKGSSYRILASHDMIGVHIKLNKGFSSYWKNPGDIGRPFNFELIDKENIEDYQILWPVPKEKMQNGFRGLIYENEVLILIKFKKENPSKPARISFDFDYAICNEACSMEIGSAKDIKLDKDEKQAAFFKKWLEFVPQNGNFNLEKIKFNGKKLEIKIANFDHKIKDFIIASEPNITFLKKKISGNKLLVTMDPVMPADIELILISDNTPPVFKTFEFRPQDFYDAQEKLIVILFYAFLGGLILNIMPCVLPVLLIKIFSILKTSQEKARSSLAANFAGIIFSFLALAIFTIVIKDLGKNVQFGFQFQNPYFLIFVVIILVIFGLNLLGSFEIKLPTIINNMALKATNRAQNEYLANFFTGMFATLLATPCSAPFLSVAISFALAGTTREILMIFSMMGIGFGLPYLVLMLFPKAIKLLPKPGIWIEILRKILGVGLILSALWFIYILSFQIGIRGAIILFLSSLALKFIIEQRLPKKFKLLIIFFIIALAFILPVKTHDQDSDFKKYEAQFWQEFDQKKIEQYLKQGKIVLVDITASWCVTCQVNKLFNFNTIELLKALEKENIIGMRAYVDNKTPDHIYHYMKEIHRYSLPINVLYGPKALSGVVLNEIVLPGKLFEQIKKVK